MKKWIKCQKYVYHGTMVSSLGIFYYFVGHRHLYIISGFSNYGKTYEWAAGCHLTLISVWGCHRESALCWGESPKKKCGCLFVFFVSFVPF